MLNGLRRISPLEQTDEDAIAAARQAVARRFACASDSVAEHVGPADLMLKGTKEWNDD
jgi:hypothetical protein